LHGISLTIICLPLKHIGAGESISGASEHCQRLQRGRAALAGGRTGRLGEASLPKKLNKSYCSNVERPLL